ncbi:hypothetical protein PUR71_01490 [Streptomyces sp. SP17BM10]|uniref:hypothetical protein n=1 Tax=Streptomyces sp. SP17BM10 TaxID=3002530 RepID=UPI002E78BFA5|nr:hypothetical protein [Streptomyces sp. SP17BM10]MEE1781613.1 hypothetical protein [Streptomyces sp. SP17BM10]
MRCAAGVFAAALACVGVLLTTGNATGGKAPAAATGTSSVTPSSHPTPNGDDQWT